MPPRPSAPNPSDPSSDSTSESASPESSDRASREARGLELLARSREFRKLLLFPASCYQEEIQEFVNLGQEKRDELEPDPKDPEAALWLLFRRTPEMVEGCRLVLESWKGENLWALPVASPNSPSRPYGLTFCKLPAGQEPTHLSEWKLVDPVTQARGSRIRLTMDPFPLEADLWEAAGMGALLKRRVFLAEPLEEQG